MTVHIEMGSVPLCERANDRRLVVNRVARLVNRKANEMKDDYYLKKLRELNQENARDLDRMSVVERASYWVFMAAFVALVVVGCVCRQ